ncbi:MAG: hypothetical protein AAB645_02320 [Patescibacteria group bacterium]
MKKKSIITVIVLIIVVGITGYYFLFRKINDFRPPITSQYTVECPKIISMSDVSLSILAKVFRISVADATTQQPLLNGKLCFIEQPVLNKPAVLEFRFVSRANSSDAKANITLPKTFELVDGNTEWTGNLEQGQQKSFRVTVKPTKTGYYHIDGSITSKDNVGRLGADKLTGIDIDVTSGGTIINPVWNKTFSPSNNLYLAVYPENSLWTVSQKFSDDRFTEFDFGHALSPENFEPIITVTYYKTGYVDNQTKVTASEIEVNVNKKNLKTKEWTYYPAVKQTITTAGQTIERAVISNWNGYDIRIDLLKAEYLPAFDTFVKLFTVTF